jgi:hypothetical protein
MKWRANEPTENVNEDEDRESHDVTKCSTHRQNYD